MACCHQGMNHFLSQCWPRSVLPFGITRPWWVNSFRPGDTICWQKSCHHWFRWWLVTSQLPSQCLNQTYNVNWTSRNLLLWTCTQNYILFCCENSFKNVWKTTLLTIEAKWCRYASVKWVIIGAGNDMLAIQYQAITWPMLIYCTIDHGNTLELNLTGHIDIFN